MFIDIHKLSNNSLRVYPITFFVFPPHFCSDVRTFVDFHRSWVDSPSYLMKLIGLSSLISLGATDHAVTTVNHIAALGNIVCCWFAPTMNFKNHE